MKWNDLAGYRPVLLALALAAAAGGCNESPSPVAHFPTAAPDKTPDYFARALEFLSRADEFDPSKAAPRVSDQLNRWIENQQPPAQWSSEPLVERLPREVRRIRPLQELTRMRFRVEDVEFLQEAVWLRDIARWASQKPSPDPLWTRWLTESESSLGQSDVQKLAVAERLFDWTIRNVQLEPLPPYPKDPTAGPAADPNVPQEAPLPAPQRGLAGPGYRYYPWQVLMFGRGDAWQRARVFILLARQQQLDAVMLAIDERFAKPRYRPWLPAVLIGRQLYLFDVALGLPIPRRRPRRSHARTSPGGRQPAPVAGPGRPLPVSGVQGRLEQTGVPDRRRARVPRAAHAVARIAPFGRTTDGVDDGARRAGQAIAAAARRRPGGRGALDHPLRDVPLPGRSPRDGSGG